MFGITFAISHRWDFNHTSSSLFTIKTRSNSNKLLLLIIFCIFERLLYPRVSRYPGSMPVLYVTMMMNPNLCHLLYLLTLSWAVSEIVFTTATAFAAGASLALSTFSGILVPIGVTSPSVSVSVSVCLRHDNKSFVL